MSNILNLKFVGEWHGIPAIKGDKGEPGADGTKFEVNARFVPGNNVVPIADFITDKGTDKEITHTIYAPKGEGGGTTVEYTDLHTFTETMTVGEIGIDGETTEIVIPANISEFANDSNYATKDEIPTVPTRVSQLFNDESFVKYTDMTKYISSGTAGRIASRYNSETSYLIGDYATEELYETLNPLMPGVYRTHLYKCVAPCQGISPTTDTTKWKEVVYFGNEVNEAFNISADNYNNETQYVLGDLVICNNTLWKCNVAQTIGVMPSTQAEVWLPTTIASELKNSGGGSSGTFVTGTVSSGTCIITDASIRADSIIDIYTDVYGEYPTSVTVSEGSIELVFSASTTATQVKVRVS